GVIACGEASFKSGGNQASPPSRTDQANAIAPPIDGEQVALTCEPDSQSIPIEVFGNSQVLKLKANICPVEENAVKTNVVFLVDLSGSMFTNDPSDFWSGKCGRSDAVNALVGKIKKAKDFDTWFNVGL